MVRVSGRCSQVEDVERTNVRIWKCLGPVQAQDQVDVCVVLSSLRRVRVYI